MGDVMQLDLRLREQLRKTDDLIASLHREIAADPDSLSLQVTLVSLEKRQRKLEKELLSELKYQHVESFDRRAIAEEKQSLS